MMETVALADSIIGQAEYDFPSDLSVFRSVQYKGFRLDNLTLNDFNLYINGYSATPDLYGPGVPVVFMNWNNKLRVFPVPNENIVGGFKIFYMRHPAQVTTIADIPEVPVQYHKAIVDFCLKQAYELDEDTAKQQVKSADFNTKMMQLSERNKRTQEYYPTITTLPEDQMDNFSGYGGYGY